MKNKSTWLHEQLSDLYAQFPYVTIKTTHTENLWRAIEELELAEGVVA